MSSVRFRFGLELFDAVMQYSNFELLYSLFHSTYLAKMIYANTEAREVSERTPLNNHHETNPTSEVKEILRTALPLVVFCFVRYWVIGRCSSERYIRNIVSSLVRLKTGISIISTGHLGVTELAAASLGMLHTNVVGLSIIIGSNGALDTLANQVS
jgi:hypothetical protein